MKDKSIWEMREELVQYCRSVRHCMTCVFASDSICVSSLLFDDKHVNDLYRRLKDYEKIHC